MAGDREPSGALAGLAAVGLAVCCGLPVVLGTGVAIGAAGVVLRSTLVIVIGAGLAVWGWRRHQQRRGLKCLAEPPGFSGK